MFTDIELQVTALLLATRNCDGDDNGFCVSGQKVATTTVPIFYFIEKDVLSYTKSVGCLHLNF